MQVMLWGGPLDGEQLTVDDPPRPELSVPQLAHWPIEFAVDAMAPLRTHHYVFDKSARRYNYAGDWG